MESKTAVKDVECTLRDFTIFCEYIKTNTPTVTAGGNLPRKACYEINAMLSHPEEGVKTSSILLSYPSVCLWFQIAKKSSVIGIDDSGKGKPMFNTTNIYEDFQRANPFVQYLNIFMTWLCEVDPEELYDPSTYWAALNGQLIDRFFSTIADTKKQQWIVRKVSMWSRMDSAQTIANQYYKVAQTLGDLGLLEYETKIDGTDKCRRTVVERMRPTKLGLSIMSACNTRRFSWVNQYAMLALTVDQVDLYDEAMDRISKSPISLFDPFLSCFPENTIDIALLKNLFFGTEDDELEKSSRVYELKVSLEQDCYCRIRLAATHTFEDLHFAIQNAFDFDDDHLYSFHLDGKKRSKELVNIREVNEPPFSDEVRLMDVSLSKKQYIL